MSERITRRTIIKSSALAVTGLPLLRYAANAVPAINALPYAPDDGWRGLKAGVASYTLRKFSLDDTIKAIQKVGIKYVSIKDFHLPMKSTAEERRAVAAKFKAGGITPISCGNVAMTNEEANIRNAFEYARDIGIKVIVCSPDPNSMAILDKMVKEFDIKIAIHNHGPEDKKFPSPYDVWNAVQKYDPRVGLCIDVGHTARAKVNPAEAIVKCQARLYDMHVKDISSTEPNGSTIEGGRGVLDLKSIVQAALKIKYSGLFSFEYEKDADDPVPGLAETIGYVRGLIATANGA